MNRSAEHRLGAFEKRRQRAETVLGAPIARFMGSRRECFGEFSPHRLRRLRRRGEGETYFKRNLRQCKITKRETGQLMAHFVPAFQASENDVFGFPGRCWAVMLRAFGPERSKAIDGASQILVFESQRDWWFRWVRSQG